MKYHVVGELGTSCVPKRITKVWVTSLSYYNIYANNSFSMVAQIVVERSLRIADVFCVLRSGARSVDGKSGKGMGMKIRLLVTINGRVQRQVIRGVTPYHDCAARCLGCYHIYSSKTCGVEAQIDISDLGKHFTLLRCL